MLEGEKNLIPFNERTEDEQREIAKKGGVASGKARRKKRTMKEAAQLILKAPANSKYKELLSECGIPEQDCTNLMAIMASAVMKAAEGDIKAAIFVRDTLGENPQYKINEKRLELLATDKDKSNSLVDEWVAAVMQADKNKP